MQLTKKIYENQFLIGELADSESLTLTSTLEYAKTLDEKGPIVTSDELSLQNLFKFYRESFPALKLTVATSVNEEALEALESGVSVKFDGSDTIDVRGMDRRQMALAKLRFASLDNITEYSRKAIRELLTDYPFIRENEAVTAVCDASPLADAGMLAGYADWFLGQISKRALGAVNVDCEHELVGVSPLNDQISEISLSPFKPQLCTFRKSDDGNNQSLATKMLSLIHI